MKRTGQWNIRGSGGRVFAVALFLPVLILQIVWISPVVEWTCVCPEGEPYGNCLCNCPKCVDARGGFESFCGLRPPEENAVKSAPGDDEIIFCDCTNHEREISINRLAFIPQYTIPEQFSLPIALITRGDDRRPPEAIPCQPEVPG